MRSRTVKLSVIVPMLNEASAIAAALDAIRARAPTAEIIVVDGGSDDGGAARPAIRRRAFRPATRRHRTFLSCSWRADQHPLPPDAQRDRRSGDFRPSRSLRAHGRLP